MNSVAKIIATNLMVLISLILFLDFVSLIILEGNYLVKESSKGDEYSEESVKKYMKNFPVYEGVDWAEKYHREKGKTKTKYYSYYGWRCSPFKGEMINIDSQGVRLTVNSTAPQSDTSIPTTVFLGGSTIWGIGVQDKYTIPSFFAKKNKEPNHVINFGEGGYSAYQSLQFLQIKIIEGLRPGLIVTYDGVNNTPVRIKRFFAHSREQQIAVRLDGIDNKEKNVLRLRDHLLKPTATLLRRVFRKASSKAETSLKSLKFTEKQNVNAAIELLETWILIKQLSERNGADFICILQPNVFVGSPNTQNTPSRVISKEYTYGYEYYKEVLRLIETPRYIKLKKHFINLTSAFDNVSDIYLDHCHVTPKGNEIIADKIVKYLTR